MMPSPVMLLEITIQCYLADFRGCQAGFSDAAETSWQQLAQAQPESKEKRQWPLDLVHPDGWDGLTAFWVKISFWFNPSFVVSDHSGD